MHANMPGCKSRRACQGAGNLTESRSYSCSATEPCTALEAWCVNLQVGCTIALALTFSLQEPKAYY